MPTGSVKLQSIKQLGQENHSYEVSDEGNVLFFNVEDLFRKLSYNQQWKLC